MISGRRFWLSSFRHFFCADIISLKAIANPVLRLRQPLVRLVRWRTVANGRERLAILDQLGKGLVVFDAVGFDKEIERSVGLGLCFRPAQMS